MSLPKIEHPIHSIKLPVASKIHNFRPFLVKEEKLLLMAKESEDSTDILRAVKQVVFNTCLDSNFSVDNITITDLNYIFIKLRSFSVDSKIKQDYRDIEDGKEYNFEINLDDIKVIHDQSVNNNIQISKNMGLLLRYPPAKVLDNLKDISEPYALIGKCIDKIYEGDKIYEASNYKTEELNNFIENLSVSALTKINEFIDSTPRLEYVISYKNSLGNERKIVLSTLDDFFMFH